MIRGPIARRGAPAHHAARPARRHWGRAAAVIAAVGALALGPFMFAPSAQAVTHTFMIDSFDATVSAVDVNKGDGVCQTAAGTCTMRAALEESNALNLPKGAVLITVADGFTGNITPPNATNTRMVTSAVSIQDPGAHFGITAPVTIDLKNQVTIMTDSDTSAAMFYVNGPDVELLNMSQVIAGESSFVMGPLANGVTIQGGATSTDANYYAERFVVLREGAKNISVRDYRIQGFYHALNATGLFYVNAQSSTPIENITIDNVHITYPTGTTCSASNGSGCRTDILQFYPRNQNVILDGFTFTNSSISNLTDRAAFPFSEGYLTTSVQASNIDISNNSFINMQGRGTGANYAFISLPVGPMAGTNQIVGNEFVRGTSGQTFAISWNGNTQSGSAGNLRIAENYFEGYSGTSIQLTNTGDVNVEKNTFGGRSASQARPAITEETRDGTTSLLDNYTNANGKVNTWFPSANAEVLTGAIPSGSVRASSPLPEDTPVCVATVDAQAPTAAPLPASTVDLDVYWTADRTAEVYLGRASQVSGDSSKLVIDLPVGPQEFPTTEVGGSQTVTIVDADTGVASGYVRFQTVASDSGQSSQYSRIVGFSGSCRPELTINQADNQNDSTLARDLHFTVKSSLSIDPASLTAEDLQLTATATAQTIDATRFNPRVVSVEPVAGSEDREFTVVVRVDDSAIVQAVVPADAVRSLGGLTNRAESSATDNEITFVNPITVQPSSFTLVTGEPDGKDYALKIAAGAPDPTAELTFTAEVDETGTEHGVAISQSDPVIAAGATASDRIRVTAEAGEVAANTPVSIAHTVVSDDPNYDQLVVRSVLVKLFSTDPSIRITKRAFTNVADSSSPDTILATGTEALSGTRLTDGQAVCFVYTVTNISQDDWATVLTDVNVTDSDTRLGTDGVIGTIPEIGIGESAMVSACGAMIPVDTTTTQG